MVAKFADNGDPNSLASRMRSKRNQRFRNAIEGIPRPLNILDVGGAQAVWESIGLVDQPDISITLLNIEPEKTSYKNVVSILGDARDMHEFRNGQFDVVYSNSVIEHVGGIEDMRKMAREIQRVGKWYFIQTPNLYFPIEPHFVFPLFQFLPISWRVYLVRHFNLGWIRREPDRERAEREVRSINLLSKTQLRSLFPDANVTAERFFGFTKSFMVSKRTG
jgi:SAM-dependent methyltransferase